MTSTSTMEGYTQQHPEEGLEFKASEPKTRMFKRVNNFALWALVIINLVALVFMHVDVSALRSRVDVAAEMVDDETGNSRHTQAQQGDTSPFRQRRGSNPESVQPGRSWTAPACVANNTQPLIHVTHVTSEEFNQGDWFTWHSDEEDGYQDLSSRHMLFRNNKFVEITQPGWYFVYSQMTYSDTMGDVIGHEVVKKVECGEGEDRILLSSRMYQTKTTYQSGYQISPLDSGYLGGVFYFSANDFVGVRPLSDRSGRETIHYASRHRNLTTGSYFGAFMLASDPNTRVADHGECCDSSILLV